VPGAGDLEAERSQLREQLGPIGLWTFQLDRLGVGDERDLVREVERAGFGSLWIAEGTASKEALTHSSVLLAATERLTVATGIANVWARDAVAMASAARYLADASGGRFVVGMGVSHAGALQRRGHQYGRPLGFMRDYLEQMNEAVLSSPQPAVGPWRMIAALRPRMLELAAELTHGAHTYFVPPSHTARARATLGPSPVLVPEQAVVLDGDADVARARARDYTSHYLARETYRNNLRDLGFDDDDVAGSGSDRLVDALVVWGDRDRITDRIAEHREAGADHVAVQILTESGALSVGDVRMLADIASSTTQ